MNTTVLYRLRSDDGDLLYIGISNRWTTRMHEHANTKPWWHEVVRADLVTYQTRDDARAAELRAINNEAPRYNIQDVPVDAKGNRIVPDQRGVASYTIDGAAEACGYRPVTIRERLSQGSFPNAWQESRGGSNYRWRIPVDDLRCAGFGPRYIDRRLQDVAIFNTVAHGTDATRLGNTDLTPVDYRPRVLARIRRWRFSRLLRSA